MKKSLLLISIISLIVISCKSSYTKIGDKNANYIPYYLKVYENANNYMKDSSDRYNAYQSYFKFFLMALVAYFIGEYFWKKKKSV